MNIHFSPRGSSSFQTNETFWRWKKSDSKARQHLITVCHSWKNPVLTMTNGCLFGNILDAACTALPSASKKLKDCLVYYVKYSYDIWGCHFKYCYYFICSRIKGNRFLKNHWSICWINWNQKLKQITINQIFFLLITIHR